MCHTIWSLHQVAGYSSSASVPAPCAICTSHAWEGTSWNTSHCWATQDCPGLLLLVLEYLPEHVSQAFEHSLLGFQLLFIAVFFLFFSSFVLFPVGLVPFLWVPVHLSLQRVGRLITGCGHGLPPRPRAFFCVFFHLKGGGGGKRGNTVSHSNKVRHWRAHRTSLSPSFCSRRDLPSTGTTGRIRRDMGYGDGGAQAHPTWRWDANLGLSLQQSLHGRDPQTQQDAVLHICKVKSK